MRRLFSILIIASAWAWIGNARADTSSLTNQLRGHTSPYLRMHEHDPTAWQLWRRQAVERARRENKVIFVSIGYFSCHWCHVMQRESYQNPEIAAYLNRHFVPIKVDRELEPALDARMIAFAEKTQGYAGWPLNVFLTPEGYPFYAVVYLPPKDFLALLQKLQALWQQNAGELKKLAAAEVGGGKGPGEPKLDAGKVDKHTKALVRHALALAAPLTGGFGDASKFPSVPQLEVLLRQYVRTQEPELREVLVLTLEQMAVNGLQDHLDGGFFRYAVDPGWKTPHFEKMLYDNALMARLYLRAGTVFKREDFTRVGHRTLGFVMRRMRVGDGGLVSSLSAIDDKGVEGGYYLWQESELKEVLSPSEWRVYRLAAGMTAPPTLSEGHLPIQAMTPEAVAQQTNQSLAQVKALLVSAREKLLKQRNKRTLPIDHKVLAAWNGLALAAFAEAAGQYTSKGYREVAHALRDRLIGSFWRDGQLHRTHTGKGVIVTASLEDYAYVAEGLLAWAHLTGKKKDYRVARDVTQAAWRRFYGKQGWRLSEPGFIPTDPAADSIPDGPMPSPPAVVMRVSLQLADTLKDPALHQQALSALNSGHELLAEDPFWYASHIGAMQQAP